MERIERFWAKVSIGSDGDCWTWVGARNRWGYGYFWNGYPISAHRYSYEVFKGPIPIGFQIDHLCKNTSCVNPNHLEAVTPQENTLRSNMSLRNKLKVVCPRGHPYDDSNTRISPKGIRECRECDRLKHRRRRGLA